jgi:hypothetical protein
MSGRQRWLVKGIIPADSIGILFGKSGSYKSFIAIDLALHIAHGLSWCGRKTETGAVFFIVGEGAVGILNRFDAWHAHRGLSPEGALFRVCLTPVALNHEERTKAVQEGIRDALGPAGRVGLIVVDTLSQNYDGDENDPSAMSRFFRNLIANLRNSFSGCTILVIHHPGHSDQTRTRGSYTIIANTDFIFRVQNPVDRHAELFCEKMKDAEFPQPQSFLLHSSDLGADTDGDAITSLAAQFNGPADDSSNSRNRRAGKHLANLTAILVQIDLPVTMQNLRTAFDAACDSGMRDDAKRKGFERAIDDAKSQQLIIERAGGLIEIGPSLEVANVPG